MVNLVSGTGISRREISKRETREYNAFLTLYDLFDEVRVVGNIEQQFKGEFLVQNNHVIPTYIPEPPENNNDWILDFETISEDMKDKYKVTTTLSVDIENSTPERRIYRFEHTKDDVPDTHYNIGIKRRAGKSKHSVACEIWDQVQLKHLLQEPSAQEELEPILRRAGLKEIVLQKRYNLFLDDFKKYYEELAKNRKLRAAQRKAAAVGWLVERGREAEFREVKGEYAVLISI